jgi:hypothetical protein
MRLLSLEDAARTIGPKLPSRKQMIMIEMSHGFIAFFFAIDHDIYHGRMQSTVAARV